MKFNKSVCIGCLIGYFGMSLVLDLTMNEHSTLTDFFFNSIFGMLFAIFFGMLYETIREGFR